jgi:hypothetical protein
MTKEEYKVFKKMHRAALRLYAEIIYNYTSLPNTNLTSVDMDRFAEAIDDAGNILSKININEEGEEK